MKTVKHRRFYACPVTSKTVSVDGVLDEAAWQDAQVVTEFSLPGEHRAPVHPTEARIVRDRKFLYVAFNATDPDIKAVHTERDSDTYRDDVLEIFIRTRPDGDTHCNFEINPLGTLRDEYHTAARRFQTGWNCDGIRIAAKFSGTLNDPEDRDAGWQLEVAIPFASLPGLEGKTPVAGDVWIFHLSRIDRSIGLKDGKELTSCAPLRRIWFHDSEHWLPLVFQGAR